MAATIIPHPNSNGSPMLEKAIAAWKDVAESFMEERDFERRKIKLALQMAENVIFNGKQIEVDHAQHMRGWEAIINVLKAKP